MLDPVFAIHPTAANLKFYDLLKPHVAHLVVCNPRKDVPLKDGNKSDCIDARKLAQSLRDDHLKPVYHGETGVRTECPTRQVRLDKLAY